jgi:hypothetical protein
MSTTTAPKLVNVNHWVEPSLLRKHGVQEDAFLTFETEWRGEPAVIEMKAHRNETYWSDCLHMGERNIYGKDSWLGTFNSNHRHCTDTAQHRMADEVRPLVEHWLGSPDYIRSESAAYASGIKGLLREFRGRGTDSGQLRKLISLYRAKLTDEQAHKLTELFDAWDNYVRLDDLTRFT